MSISENGRKYQFSIKLMTKLDHVKANVELCEIGSNHSKIITGSIEETK